MKKVIYAILIAALATAMLGGCQDVPEPYTNPNENKGGNQEVLEPGTPTGKGTEAEPYNVTAALAKIKTLKDGENTGEIFVKGKIRSVKEVDTDKFYNATYFISDDITKKMDSLQIYRSKYLGNAKFTADNQIKVGDEVVIYGTFINFKGNTPETEANKSYIFTLNGKKEAGGTTPEKPETPQTGKGLSIEGQVVTLTAADTEVGTETVTYEMSKLGNDDIAKVDPINLGGGLTLTVEQSDGQTVPAYFGKYKNLRLYANNIFTITGNKKIAKVVLNCDKFKEDIYVGNATATVSFSGNSVTYKNVFSEPKGGGVQMRILKVTVIYAK